MLRNKLSLLIAAAGLTFGFTGCDDGGDDGDTGAAGTESSETADPTSDTADTEDTAETADDASETAETADPTTDTADTEEPTTDTADTEDTSDTAEDSTGEADPCADVVCEDGVEECIAGICVPIDESESETGGDGDANYPNPAGGCPAGTVDGNSALMDGINICLADCVHAGATNILDACPQPATGTAVAACVLGGGGSETPCDTPQAACETEGEYCLTAAAGADPTCFAANSCLVNCGGGATCPDGMACNAASLCEYE